MKRIIDIVLLVSASLLTVSCRISDGFSSRHNPEGLRTYTYSLMNSMLDSPLQVMDLMTEIDVYLRLPDAEKMKEEYREMRENLKNLDLLSLKYIGAGQIDTDGKSLFEVGSRWCFVEDGYFRYSASWRIYPGHKDRLVITCVGENEWEIEEDGNGDMLRMHVTGTQSEAVAGKLDYAVTCSGLVAPDEDGYSAEFSTGGMLWRNSVDDTYDDPYCYRCYTGDFYVRIFSGGAEKDWCCMISGPDGTLSYETNL
ncbi:MAG: hypothetical protein K2H10_06325 [Bacteroidales bacterium]|nr:hypothetical protein [Bacteroidales bacterium]